MSDLIQVQLPRDVVEDLGRANIREATEKRKAAKATERNAPKTKRNAKAIAQWLEEADIAQLVARQCADALASQPEVTDHAAD